MDDSSTIQFPMFERYIGIDYSGAGSPLKRNKALQVFTAAVDTEPDKVRTCTGNNWNRKEVACYCLEQLKNNAPIIIGIDHAFSFPVRYMKSYDISSWHHFLEDFHRHWPTDQDNISVGSLRENNERTGNSDEFRLTENWTSSTKSVFQFGMQGQVAMASHAGIPWLRFLKNHPDLSARVHFWPFDGFQIPKGKHVVAEVYPAIFKRRFTRTHKSSDEHDAFAIAMWLKQMDSRGVLGQYFNPPLSDTERKQVLIEGWILGVY
jgi:hypothetical protein